MSKTHDFYFDLPPELIAQTPLERRDSSRLLTLNKSTGETRHLHFFDLPKLLRPGDCLVLNDSRVLPARLLGRRETGGACEVLLLIDRGEKVWECLVRPGKKLHTGAKISFGDGALTAQVVGEVEGGNRLVRFDYEGIFLETLERLHQGGTGRPGAVSDRLFQGNRICGRTHSRPAFYQGIAGAAPDNGCKALLCNTSCGPRNLPPRQGGGLRGP